MSGAVAVGAFLVPSAFIVFHHGGRNDSCRYGDDRIADKHHAGGKKLSESGDRGDVTIAYGGHGDDCPVDTVRDVVELGIGLRALYHVHQRSDRSHQNDDEQEKDGYLLAAFAQGGEQPFAFVQEIEQLEYTEYAYQTESADDEQVTCAGEKQADIEREGSQQVYNAEETEYVFPWAGRTVNACQVFESEESGEKDIP